MFLSTNFFHFRMAFCINSSSLTFPFIYDCCLLFFMLLFFTTTTTNWTHTDIEKFTLVCIGVIYDCRKPDSVKWTTFASVFYASTITTYQTKIYSCFGFISYSNNVNQFINEIHFEATADQKFINSSVEQWRIKPEQFNPSFNWTVFVNKYKERDFIDGIEICAQNKITDRDASMSDDIKHDLLNNWNEYNNETCEVSYLVSHWNLNFMCHHNFGFCNLPLWLLT